MVHIALLPTEILSLIVHDLGQRDLYHCALVNTGFHTAAMAMLWASVQLIHPTKADPIIASLPVTGHHVRSLKMRGLFGNEWTLLHIMKYTRLLERLYLLLSGGVTDTSFLQLPHYCPNLTTIYLVHADMYGVSLDTLVQQCPRFRHLGLRGCHNLSCTTFAGLKQSSLETLSLGGFGVNDWAALELSMADLLGMPTLTHLGLWNSPARFVRRLLKKPGLMPQLTHLALDVSGISGESLFVNNMVDEMDVLLASFVQAHPSLTGLDLRKSQCTDRVLATLTTTLSSSTLTYLDVSHNPGLSSHGVRQLVMHCPTLSFVALDACSLDASDFPELNNSNSASSSQTDNEFRLNKSMMNKIRGDNAACDNHHNHTDNNRDQYWAMMYDKLR